MARHNHGAQVIREILGDYGERNLGEPTVNSPGQRITFWLMLCVGLSTETSREMWAQSNPLPASVRYLSDTNYQAELAAAPRLVVVEFFQRTPSCSDAELLNTLGDQTNRMRVCRVDLGKNPKLAAQFEASTLGNVRRGERYGKSIPVRKTPCLMLLLNDKPIDCIEEEDGLATSWNSLEVSMVEWFYNQLSGLKYRALKRHIAKWFYNHIAELHGKTIIDGEVGISDTELAVAIEAVKQRDSFYRHYSQYQATNFLWTLGEFPKPEDVSQVAPLLVSVLDGDRFSERAARLLAAYGTAAAPVVSNLVTSVEELEWKLGQKFDPETPHLTRNDRDRMINDRRRITNRGVDAIRDLGAIGPAAQAAAPILGRICEREYREIVRIKANRADMSEDELLGMLAVLSLNRIRSPAPIAAAKSLGKLEGTAYYYVTGSRSEQHIAPGTRIVFWKERDCYTTVAKADGTFQIELPTGDYIIAAVNSVSHQRDSEFSPYLDSRVIRIQKGGSTNVDVAAFVVMYDNFSNYGYVPADTGTNSLPSPIKPHPSH